MIRIDRVLAPIDFSEPSRAALDRATVLAEDFGAELHVLHVVPDPEVATYPPFSLASDGESIRQAIHAAHEKEFATLLAALPVAERRVAELRRGPGIAPTIVGYAEEIDADLVVMGTHGHRGFRRFLLGSVAEEVVRRSPCPVLTNPQEATASAARAQNILAAVDLSELSHDVLRTAGELASRWGSKLRVLHVVAPLPAAGYHEAFFETAAALDPAALEKRAREVLERLIAEDGLEERAELELVAGVPQHAIAAAGVRHACDLIVVASHGLGGLEHALLGSTAERLLRRAESPVLVLRADGKELARAS